MGFQQCTSCANSTASGTSAPATAPITPPPPFSEITIVGWINASAIDLPSGENPLLQIALNNSNLVASAACDALLADWATTYPAAAPDLILGTADVAYANAWLLKNSGNTIPPTTLPAGWANGGNFRVFNDFQVDSGGNPIINTALVGGTPDPCQSGLVPAQFRSGQAHPNNGTINTSPSGEKFQLNEGRVGTLGQLINQALNLNSVPWIYNVIEFDPNGNPAIPPIRAVFPTYYLYVNGALYSTYPPQASVSAFSALSETQSQELPSQVP
jgi:hypothetical protein